MVQIAVLQQQVWDGNMAANEHRKELEAQTLKVRYPTTGLHAVIMTKYDEHYSMR